MDTNTTNNTKQKLRQGFFPFVYGDRVDVAQAGAIVVACKNDLHLTMGGGSTIFAGNRIHIKQGGGNLIASGGGVSIERGGAGLVAARDIKLSKSYVGIALAGSIEVAEDSRLIVSTQGAAIFGIVVGAVVAGIHLLSRERRGA